MKFKSVRVLYAEDVAFFRKHVSKLLAGAGIDITTVEDGKKALQELDASDADRYNLILSDIEMPNLNGLELAREIRKRERFKNIPIVALTTRFRDSDILPDRCAMRV
jgi:two-component system chemotaxis sensor kinase CheA